MTHDELLAKVNNYSCCSGAHELALRAVVELHKPDGGLCNHCEEGFIMGSIPVVYPCPTIQVIEEQLHGNV